MLTHVLTFQRPRWLPAGNPPLDYFFRNMIKMMCFNVKIIISHVFNVFLNMMFHETLKKTLKIIFSIRFYKKKLWKTLFFFIKKNYFFKMGKTHCFFVQMHSRIIRNDEILIKRSKSYNDTHLCHESHMHHGKHDFFLHRIINVKCALPFCEHDFL